MRVLISIIILSVVLSCKKDKEMPPPVVVILSPAAGTSYSAGQSVKVEGNVTSEEELTGVTVSLLNSDMISAGSTQNISFSQTSASINTSVELPSSLDNGTYFIQVRATNRSDYTNRYVEIVISSLSTTKTMIYALASNPLGTYLYAMDSMGGQFIRKNNYPGTYSSSSASEANDLLSISFSDHDLLTVKREDHSLAWSLDDYNSVTPTFSNVSSGPSNFYVSFFQDHFVKAYDKNGNAVMTATSPQGYSPGFTYLWGQYLVVENNALNISQQGRLSFRYNTNGAGVQEANLPSDVRRLVGKNSNELLVFGNNGSEGRIDLYYFHTNSFSVLKNLSSEEIIDAVSISEDDLLVSTSSQIYTYRISTNSLVSYLSYPGAVLDYIAETDDLIIGTGTSIFFYDASSRQMKRSLTPGGDIRGVHHLSF